MNAPANIQPSIIAALAKALAEIEGVQKNKSNPGLKGVRYADLAAVIDAIESIKAHGLWFRQVPKVHTDGALIETFYIHESGEEMSAGETFVRAGKQDPQGFGSALTYCRRYALMTAFGLAAEDDDGHAATQAARGGGQQRQSDNRSAEPRQQSKPSGGMSDASFAKITQLLQATNTPVGAMLDNYKVKQVRDLTKAQFDDAVEYLEGLLARMAKAESNDRAAPADGFGDIEADSIPF